MKSGKGLGFGLLWAFGITVVIGGCAPAHLGGSTFIGEPGAMLVDEEDWGAIRVTSSGNDMELTITIAPDNDRCVGQFTLIDTESSLGVIGGDAPKLIYSGKFETVYDRKCLKLLGNNPPGTELEVTIERNVGWSTDVLYICTTDLGILGCGGPFYTFKEVKEEKVAE